MTKEIDKTKGAYPLMYQNRNIGTVIENFDDTIIFIKRVSRIKHFMRIIDGYGIQEEAFNQYLKGKKGKIRISEDNKKIYEADIRTWEEHSKTADYGFGKQIFLSLKYMGEI